MPTKNCPECSRDVNVRKLFCDCGHVFTLRRTKRVGIKSWKSEMQAIGNGGVMLVCQFYNNFSHWIGYVKTLYILM